MSQEQAKKKTALPIIGYFFAMFAFVALFILLHEFLYAAIFFISVISCFALTCWGLWDELWQETYARQKMIDDLYAMAHTAEHKKWTKFFIEYFKL